MTEPVKMWAVVRDDGDIRSMFFAATGAKISATNWNEHPDGFTYTVKPCEVRIIEDE